MRQLKRVTFLVLAINLLAQEYHPDLFDYYEQQNYGEIKKQLTLQQLGAESSLEIRFFKALFIEDGEEAKNEFQFIFETATGKIKTLAAKKLMDYYYAKGYYVNAANFQKFLSDKESGLGSIISYSGLDSISRGKEKKMDSPEIPSELHYIQVGAFTLIENAEQLQKMLVTQNINSKIVERIIGDKKLYCIWLQGFSTFEETLKYANEIKERYDLKFRIIKQ